MQFELNRLPVSTTPRRCTRTQVHPHPSEPAISVCATRSVPFRLQTPTDYDVRGHHYQSQMQSWRPLSTGIHHANWRMVAIKAKTKLENPLEFYASNLNDGHQLGLECRNFILERGSHNHEIHQNEAARSLRLNQYAIIWNWQCLPIIWQTACAVNAHWRTWRK